MYRNIYVLARGSRMSIVTENSLHSRGLLGAPGSTNHRPPYTHLIHRLFSYSLPPLLSPFFRNCNLSASSPNINFVSWTLEQQHEPGRVNSKSIHILVRITSIFSCQRLWKFQLKSLHFDHHETHEFPNNPTARIVIFFNVLLLYRITLFRIFQFFFLRTFLTPKLTIFCYKEKFSDDKHLRHLISNF